MKKKAPEFILEYSYEKLGSILKDATEKAKAGKLDLEGKLFGIAAGYAQDFVDTSWIPGTQHYVILVRAHEAR